MPDEARMSCVRSNRGRASARPADASRPAHKSTLPYLAAPASCTRWLGSFRTVPSQEVFVRIQVVECKVLERKLERHCLALHETHHLIPRQGVSALELMRCCTACLPLSLPSC